MKALMIITIVGFLVQCGTEEQPEQSQSTPESIGYVDEVEDEPVYYVELPKCNDRKQERLVYVIYEEEYLICRDGQWQYLEIKETCDVSNESKEILTDGGEL